MKFLIVLVAALATVSAGRVDIATMNKVRTGELTEVILELPQITEQINAASTFQAMPYGDERTDALVSMMQELTSSAQAPFVSKIQGLGLEYEQFWGSNIILIKGVTEKTLNQLSTMSGDFTIREQFYASIHPAIVHGEVDNTTQTYQWGVSNVRAPQAWARCNGANQVVCIIDTGVAIGHTALNAGYAGGWRDPYYNTAGPTDQHGHGSHCAGSAVGRANGVGVAPGARWNACRGLNHQGSGTEAALTSCGQWVLTANPRPTVVSNSWGGGGGRTWYNSVVNGWNNAGITPVFAIGNSGSNCRTGGSPGDQPNLISVGATTNSNNAMASFSSRGPYGSAVKPEISAPGQNIVSCGTGSSNYVTMSGTSMATPHVAGAVAIVRQCHSTTNRQTILNHLSTSAVRPTVSSGDAACCGGGWPNCAFGNGKIDVGAAVGV